MSLSVKFDPTYKGVFLNTIKINLEEKQSELRKELKKLEQNKINTTKTKELKTHLSYEITSNRAILSTLEKIILFQRNKMIKDYDSKIKSFNYTDKEKDDIITKINNDLSEITDKDYVKELESLELELGLNDINSNSNPGPFVPEEYPVYPIDTIPSIPPPIFITPPNPKVSSSNSILSLDTIMSQNINLSKIESPKPNYSDNFKKIIEEKKSFSQDNNKNNMNTNPTIIAQNNANIIAQNLLNTQTVNINKTVPKVPNYSADFILHEPLDTSKLPDLQENWVFKILKGDAREKLKKILEIDFNGKTLAFQNNNVVGKQKQQYNEIFTEDFAVYLVRERPNLIGDIVAVLPNWLLSERIIYNAVRANINFNKKSGKLLKSPLIFLSNYEPKYLMPFILLTVQNNGNSIENFKRYQNEKLQLAAIENDAKSIQYIDSPTKAVVLKVIRKDPLLIKYISKNFITREVRNLCIKSNGLSIQYFSNPTEKEKIIAITNNLDSIKFLRAKQSIGFQLIFLELLPKNRYSLIKNIIKPNLEVQARIIELDFNNVQWIENPHWKIIAIVINQNPNQKKLKLYWGDWIKSKFGVSIKTYPEYYIEQHLNEIATEEFTRYKNRLHELVNSKKVIYSANSRMNIKKGNEKITGKKSNNNNNTNNNNGNNGNNGNNNNRNPKNNNNTNNNNGNNIENGYANLLEESKIPSWWKGKPEDYNPNHTKKSNSKLNSKKSSSSNSTLDINNNPQEDTPKKHYSY